MRVRILGFKGEQPRVADHLIGDRNASIAKDCKLRNGNIEPFNAPGYSYDLAKTLPKTIFKYQATPANPDGFWLHWSDDVDVAESVIIEDTDDTVFITGDGVPKYTDASIATTGGGGNYPVLARSLGLPQPSTKPGVALGAAQSGAITDIQVEAADPWTVTITSASHGLISGKTVKITGVVGMTEINDVIAKVTVVDSDSFTLDNVSGETYSAYTSGGTWTRNYTVTELEQRAYVYTYLNDKGWESIPSPESDILEVGPGQSVSLSGMSQVPTPDPGYSYNVTGKRIYRTVTSGGVTSFKFVTELVHTATTFVDDKEVLELGDSIKSTLWGMPPADLAGIDTLDNGITFGHSGRSVCLTPRWIPYGWPVTYRYATDHEVVAAAGFGNTIVAATRKYPYMIVGTDPARMSSNKLAIPQGCVSKRSMQSLGQAGVIYASPDGLVLIGTGGYRIVTMPLFTREQWQALGPEDMFGLVHDNKYYCFHSTGAFVFDPQDVDAGVVFLSIVATGGYVDHLSDTMFLIINNDIYEYEAGSAASFQWRSRIFYTTDAAPIQAALVRAVGPGSVGFKLYADDVLKMDTNVATNEPFRLPGGYRMDKFQIELSGLVEVAEVRVGTTMSELRYDE